MLSREKPENPLFSLLKCLYSLLTKENRGDKEACFFHFLPGNPTKSKGTQRNSTKSSETQRNPTKSSETQRNPKKPNEIKRNPRNSIEIHY